MNLLPFILATAGHVDHGKSALVKALSGIDPDRLPEEKARGITIDLGFAHLRLGSGACAGREFEIGIIDVPGHEDFVRNMVAGAGSVDAALLVVAADDGWMPQTQEHLHILGYLGVARGVVALSKADLAPDRSSIIRLLRQKLDGTALADAPIIPTSIVTGEGLAALQLALADLFSTAAPQPDLGKPRLPIDRAFELKGAGTVVTGTLTGGSLERGQGVILQPGGIEARVRGIQTYRRDVDEAHPGMRVALNLAAPGFGLEMVRRGDCVTVVGAAVCATRVDVLLLRMEGEGLPQRISDGLGVAVHHAAAWRGARLRLLDRKELALGETALARLDLSAPLAVVSGDRLVIRDASHRHTIAGGVVLDVVVPRSRRRGARMQAQLQLLRARAQRPADAGTFLQTQIERDSIVNAADIRQMGMFSGDQLEQAARGMCSEGTTRRISSWLAHAEWFGELVRGAARAIDEHHGRSPQDSGLPLVDLRKLALSRLPASAAGALEAVVGALCEQLSHSGYEIRPGQAVIGQKGHIPRLPARLQGAGERIRRRLAERGLDVVPMAELAADDVAHQALRFLMASGQAVDLGGGLVMGAQAYASASAAVCAHLRSHGPATVSQLKSALGSSRRVVVPLLERMDRERITRRRGDQRELGASGGQAAPASTRS